MFLTSEERLETIKACRFCPMCYAADRTASLMRRESYSPRGRSSILSALDQGMIPIDETVADIFYTSLNDGLLAQWCVGNYDHEELVIDTRARIFQQGLAPQPVKEFVGQLSSRETVHAGPRSVLAEAGVSVEKKSDLLLFSGCSTLKTAASTIIATGRLFNQAGVSFQVLEDEPCCGWPLYQLGDFEGARAFSARVREAVMGSGAKRVVAVDADCYRMLSTRTARFVGDLGGVSVAHAVGELANLLQKGALKVRKALSAPITYHDPCALARYCEDNESPRAILKAITNGEIREMATSGKWANCCGAGGMLEVIRPELAARVALLRLEEALETGASTLATGCPRCADLLSRAAASDASGSVRVMNLVDLLAEAAI
jgi:Fe-S oxidoreductase